MPDASLAGPSPGGPDTGQAETEQRGCGYPGDRDSIHLDPPVEPAHVGLGEQATQLGQRGHGGRRVPLKVRAHHCGGLVWREEALIVLQHHQIVAGDESIGGVAIDHVHLPSRQGLILHRRQERPHRAEAEAIGLLQAGQAVGPADKVGREPRLQGSGYPSQVAERGQIQLPSGLPPHCDGIGVLKAQRREPAHAVTLAKLARHLPEYLARVGAGALTQNRQQSRPGVFRIHIDGIGSKGLERDLGGAQPEPPVNREVPGLQQLRKHLCQQERLSEGFRRNHDRPIRRGLGSRKGRNSHEEDQPSA